jgi:hypothetical protein
MRAVLSNDALLSPDAESGGGRAEPTERVSAVVIGSFHANERACGMSYKYNDAKPTYANAYRSGALSFCSERLRRAPSVL